MLVVDYVFGDKFYYLLLYKSYGLSSAVDRMVPLLRCYKATFKYVTKLYYNAVIVLQSNTSIFLWHSRWDFPLPVDLISRNTFISLAKTKLLASTSDT